MIRSLLPALSLFLTATLSLQGAILIDNFASGKNDRFQDSDSPDDFILQNFDLSGVGQDSSGRWATLIGTNTIISANHFKPSGTITFHTDNDPSGSIVQFGITGDTLRIANTDLWIARIDGFAPSSLNVFDYAKTNLSSSSNPFLGQLVFMTVRSPTSFSNTTDQAYGTNIVSDFFENEDLSLKLSGATAADIMYLDYTSKTTTYEAVVQTGDSGAPLFYQNGGSLALLGVNSVQYSSSGNPVGTGVSYIGNDSATIDSQIATWAAVPEPQAALPVGVLALIALYFNKRKKN